MTTTVAGVIIENRITWVSSEKQRQTAFSHLDTYKQKLLGIKTQMLGLGDIKIKVDGLKEAKSELEKIKAQASKPSSPLTSAPTSGTSGTSRSRTTRDPRSEAIKEQNRLERLQARIIKFENSDAMQRITTEQRKQIVDKLKLINSEVQLGVAISNNQRELRETSRVRKQMLREQNKLNFAQERGVSSIRQMAGAAFSVYTAYSAIASVTKVGMDFQKIGASLLSVSENAKEAKDNMKFVRSETLRLGGDLVQNAKAFAKLLASKGSMSLSQVREIYTGVSEMAATRGLTADEVSGSINALNQMAGKTKVQAEELRQQLAERLPGSVTLFAQAAKDAGLTVNGTVSELEDLMRNGKALADQILPKAAQAMSSASKKSLGMALQNLSVQLSRAKTNFDIFQKDLFDKGVEDGIKVLLEGFYELMRSSEVIASFLGGAFKGAVLGLVTPFRLVHAAIHDLFVFLGGEWSTSNKDFAKDIISSTGAVMGLVTALWALKKASSLLKGIRGAGGAVVDTITGGGQSKGSKGGGLLSGMGKRVFVTNMPKGGFVPETGGDPIPKGKVALAAMAAAVATTAAAGVLALEVLPNSSKGNKYSAANVLGSNFAFLDQPLFSGYNPKQNSEGGASQYLTQQPQKVQIEVKMDNDALSAKVVEVVNSSYQGTYY